MGGGDLNLKKSWHPSTLRNIERVWKAEQKHEVERQKIEQLQKELAEERAREEIQTFAEDQGVVRKRDERLDWMYQGPSAMVNREDYLLGRKIDKTLEILEQEESGVEKKKEEYDVGATMFSSQDLSGTATVDLATKIREDPLFNIMKKEKEQRKNLLSNPVKMKQLQQMLQDSLGKGKSKKSKKSKKHSSDSDSEERKHRRKQKKDKQARQQNASDSEDERKLTKDRSKDHYMKARKTDDRYERESTYQNKHYNSHSRERDYMSKYAHRSSDNYSSRGHTSRESHSRIPHQDIDSENQRKKKLATEERERRLQEMQDNAKWREQQRERNTKRYREEDQEESKDTKMDTSDFIKPMLSRAAEKGSLENRVKQKIFSLQRGSGVMDKHFARR